MFFGGGSRDQQKMRWVVSNLSNNVTVTHRPRCKKANRNKAVSRDVRNERETQASAIDAGSRPCRRCPRRSGRVNVCSLRQALQEQLLKIPWFQSRSCHRPATTLSVCIALWHSAAPPLDAHHRTCLSRQPSPQCAVRAANLRGTATLRSSPNTIL